jgi:ActR/RegA family two-component response regulator
MVCHYALVAADDAPTITIQDLPPAFLAEVGLARPIRRHRVTPGKLKNVLATVGGSRHAAARVLGIDRRQVQRVLKSEAMR